MPQEEWTLAHAQRAGVVKGKIITVGVKVAGSFYNGQKWADSPDSQDWVIN